MDYRIVTIRAEDWPRLRELRLQMLKDTPIAFVETLADALAAPDSEWMLRARRCAAPGSTGLVAVGLDGEWVGTMSAFVDRTREREGLAMLVGVWVHPDHRGRERGVADALLDAVLEWARGQQPPVCRLLLDVHEENPPARAFYERRGFTATGIRNPYPLDPATTELEMALALGPYPSAPGWDGGDGLTDR